MTGTSHEGSVVLVTGGGSGFGRSCALVLAERGADVAVFDIDQESAESTAREVSALGQRALPLRVDVTDEASVAAAVAKVVSELGDLTGAVNSAGVTPRKHQLIGEYDLEVWNQVMNVNLLGVMLCSKYELAHMARAGAGAVVNVSSIGGLGSTTPGLASYNTSKHAVIGLTRASARDYADRGIRVNAICPGSMVTPMTASVRDADDETYARMAARIPFGRMAEPEEVAGAVAFLLSADARWITGQALVADGGTLL